MRLAEVLARAGREHRELGVEAGDAVHDLVQRAVAADDDQQLVRRGGLARELDQVPRPLREQRLAVEPELLRARARSSGQRLPGRAVRARRVDEEHGHHAGPRASLRLDERGREAARREPISSLR